MCLDGEPELKETENVVVLFENGCDDAGFVQIMEGTGDESKLRDLDQRFLAFAAELRPDLLGGYRGVLRRRHVRRRRILHDRSRRPRGRVESHAP